MKIFICIKAVVDPDNIQIDENGNIKRDSLSLKLNKADEYAIENALLLKDKYNLETIAITMGPENSQEVSKYAFSKGIDKTFLITDPKLKGSDCLITSKVLSHLIKKLADKDFIVLCGAYSEDGNTSIVPPQISYFLNIPGVFGARRVELDEDKLIAYMEDCTIELSYPAVVSIDISSDIKPRLSPLPLRLKAKNHRPTILSLKDISLEITSEESPTSVISVKKIPTITFKDTKVLDLKNPHEINEIRKILYE